MNLIYKKLTDENFYTIVISKHIKKLHQKSYHNNLEIEYLEQNISQIAKYLSDQIKSEEFTFGKISQIKILSPKIRIVNRFEQKDLIMQKAMAEALEDTYANIISKHVYSGMKNNGNYSAVKKFLTYIKKNHCRDMYVYKTDIANFFGSIPLGTDSLIWQKIDKILHSVDSSNPIPSFIRELYHKSFDITSYLNGGSLTTQGLLIGMPLSMILANLYISDIDEIATTDLDIFYSRFNDDILISHNDPNKLITITKNLEQILCSLKLSLKKEKTTFTYYTKSGRPDPANSVFRNSSNITYLGYNINASGKTIPSPSRVQNFLTKCKNEINNTQTHSTNLENSGKVLCHKLKKKVLAYDYNKNNIIKDIIIKTNDPVFLKQIDLQIATWVAEKLCNIKGKKAFRQVSYSTIRNNFGLPSLVSISKQIYPAPDNFNHIH